MQKQFVSSLTLLLLVNFLVKPLWIFGIDLQVQNTVGAEQYGLYAGIFSFSIIINIFLDLGLSHYSNRNMAQNPERLSDSFSKLTSLKFLLGLVYFVIAAAGGFYLGYWHKAIWLLILLATNQFLQSLLIFFRSHLAGLHLFKADALMSVLDKALTIILCGGVLYTTWFKLEMTILLFAALQTTSFALAAVFAFALLYKKTRLFKFSISLSELSALLKKSFPYALLILLMSFYTRVDSVMLQQISGDFENGIYAQAFRLLDAINQPGYLFSVLLLPMFAGMTARKEPVRDLTRLAFSLVLVITTAISMAGAFNAPALMAWLYTDHPELSSPVLQMLIFSSIAFGGTYIFGTLLTARGNMRVLNGVALIGFLLNIVLNFILIPKYGAMGAAFATVFTQGGTAVIQIIISFRIANFRFAPNYWLRMAVFFMLAAIFSWGLMQLFVLDWGLRFLLQFALVVALAAGLKLLPLQAAIELIRKRFTTD